MDLATIWNTSNCVLYDRKIDDNEVSFHELVPITDEQKNTFQL